MANLFRVMLQVIAANLLVQLRSMIADPPEALPSPEELPVEVRSQSLKRQQHNRRRKADPLGEGHPSTWRTMIIKVATRVIVSTRRVRLLIASSWPYAHLLEKLGHLLAPLSTSPFWLMAEPKIANLKSQISNLKSQISNLKSQISNLKSTSGVGGGLPAKLFLQHFKCKNSKKPKTIDNPYTV